MFTQSDVEILLGQLPDKGVNKIHLKTKISKPTISKFFKGGKVRTDNAQRIYSAALSIIEKNNNKEDQLRKKTSKIIKSKVKA